MMLHRQKYYHKNEKSLDKSLEFCIECGDDLNDFAVSKPAKDKNALEKNFDNCKHTGKFKGDICSKLFISDSEEPSALDEIEW